jgi:hypothetical protein
MPELVKHAGDQPLWKVSEEKVAGRLWVEIDPHFLRTNR